MMIRLHLLLILGALASWAAAESAPTFCKCTCFTNSTIVRLGPADPSSNPTTSSQLFLRSLNPFTTSSPPLNKRAASSSCTQCNRAFCLKYNLPICKDATEKDVVAMCFQRDSRKDQIIVWGFILGTTGLLGWAALKRFVEMRDARKLGGAALAGIGAGSNGLGEGEDRGAYAPVGR